MRCINCGGYEDRTIDPEGCVCVGDERAIWQIERDEAAKAERERVSAQ